LSVSHWTPDPLAEETVVASAPIPHGRASGTRSDPLDFVVSQGISSRPEHQRALGRSAATFPACQSRADGWYDGHAADRASSQAKTHLLAVDCQLITVHNRRGDDLVATRGARLARPKLPPLSALRVPNARSVFLPNVKQVSTVFWLYRLARPREAGFRLGLFAGHALVIWHVGVVETVVSAYNP
jgi:hypothetical protein